MQSLHDSMASITKGLRYLTQFGMTLIIAFVIIDMLFPETAGVIANLGNIVGQFSKEELSDLIALLLFLILFRDKKADS